MAYKQNIHLKFIEQTIYVRTMQLNHAIKRYSSLKQKKRLTFSQMIIEHHLFDRANISYIFFINRVDENVNFFFKQFEMMMFGSVFIVSSKEVVTKRINLHAIAFNQTNAYSGIRYFSFSHNRFLFTYMSFGTSTSTSRK